MKGWQSNSKSHKRAAALLFPITLGAILSCTLPTGQERSNHTPISVTPRITLPQQWTDTPETDPLKELGWAEFQGNGVSLWLPDRYRGGDPTVHLEDIILQIREMGSEFEETAQSLEANPGSFLLWVFDTEVSAVGFRPNVNVVFERVPPEITMAEYLEAALDHIPEEYQVLSTEVTSLGNFSQIGVILLQINLYGHDLKEIGYIIKKGGTIFITTYACNAVEFDTQLPVFEQSIATFEAEG
jgi:hypothetical protein